MILSGKEILRQIETKRINIDPFSESQLNPNSYNLRLYDTLQVYNNQVLDMKRDILTRNIHIPESGLTLYPGTLYLGRTVERAGSRFYVPMIEGRSSLGRLGLHIHITAGFGDVGFSRCWTLEIQCVQPIIIYPNIEICQIYFHTLTPDYDLYEGKYQDSDNTQRSMMWKEFL
jgi:dCTP deaminase